MPEDREAGQASGMPRVWVWLQLVLGWLPVWALYTTLILSAHPGVPFASAAQSGLRAIGIAAVLGLGVWRLTLRLPWPHPFRWRFAAFHLVGAAVYAGLFAALNAAMERGLPRPVVIDLPGDGAPVAHLVVLATSWFPRFLILGVWFYVMVAGVAYATRGTERAARAEALAARAQLAALRAQLHPHFLFNALHTVVQLIPREPARAAHAAELVAGLLRTTLEEDRDLIPLADEWAFVERYLEVERIRFGERLRVHADLGDAAGALIPAFALQTLVENAVRHGAAPRVEPTEVRVEARVTPALLRVTVRDDGAGADPAVLAAGGGASGTGLRHLRDRLAALYGGSARLDLATRPDGGFTAALRLPRAGTP